MIKYPGIILGCPLPTSYNLSKNPSTSALTLLRGRNRHRLEDLHAVWVVSLAFDMSQSQFNGWQTFWTSIGKGVEWFGMRLIMDVVTGEDMACHATAPFNASMSSNGNWSVSLNIEAMRDD